MLKFYFQTLPQSRVLRKLLESMMKANHLLKNIWKLPVDNEKLISINNKDYKVTIIEGNHDFIK